jgi:Type IV secretion-system coupling protein DNA-binding domain
MRRDRDTPPQPPDPADLLDGARRRFDDTLAPIAARWPLIAAVLIALVIVAVLLPRWRARQLARHARVVTIGAPPTADPGGALLLWSSLHALLRSRAGRLLRGSVHLAWEIAADDGGARFRMWVPRTIPTGLLERTVTAAWPGATLDDGDDLGSAGSLEDGYRRVVELAPTGPDWFPIGTGSPDPLPLVLGQLADLGTRQQVLVQVLARPATHHERRRLRATARRLRAGTPRIGWLTLGGQQRTARPAPDPTIAPDVRAVLDKAAHPGYRCLVRITVSAPNRRAAAGRARAVAGAFAAYDGRAGLRSRRHRASLRRVVERRLGRGAFLLSVPELAALAHLPTDETTPGVDRAGARSVPPPPRLPATGKPLGIASNGRRVVLAPADARHHLHLLGPTGTGKSTLIARLALDDLAAGRGAVVIDPKGDLVEDILDRIPADKIDRVDLLDPHDPKPPALNVLEGRDTDLVVDQLVGIFHRLYERSWGPRTDDILRSSLLTLARAPEPMTLADVPRLLTDDAWRKTLTEPIDDPVGLGPFWQWYDSLSEATRAQVTGPVSNKLRALLLRRSLRSIIGQPRSTLDITRALDAGRLLLCSLPKGTLGEDTSRLLGSIVVARVWQAALARAAVAPEQRRDAALYVDEVHNYLNLPTPVDDVLAEARGYRLSLALAHQHLAQLPRDLREGISANARTKVYFQLSADDAAALDRDVQPDLSRHDLAHLPQFTTAVRLCHSGQTSRAFTLTTEPLAPATDSDRAEQVRQHVRGRLVDQPDVDAVLERRQRRTPLDRRERDDEEREAG